MEHNSSLQFSTTKNFVKWSKKNTPKPNFRKSKKNGCLEKLSQENLMNNLKHLNHLKLENMFLPPTPNKKLRLFLEEVVNDVKATTYFKLASIFLSHPLLNTSLVHMEQNLLTVAKTDGYLDLDYKTVAKLVLSKSLPIFSEFNAAFLWLKHKFNERRHHANNLLLKVRLHLLTGNQLEETFSEISSLTNVEETLNSIIELRRNKEILNFGYLIDPTIFRIDYRTNKVINVKKIFDEQKQNHRDVVYLDKHLYDFKLSYEELIMTVNVFNLESGVWSGTTKFGNFSVDCFSVYQDDIYAIGATALNGNFSATQKCYRYNPRRGKLSEIARTNEKREEAACAVFMGGLVTSGGVEIEGLTNKNSCEIYRDGEWRPIQHMINGRSGHTLVAVNKQLYVVDSSEKFFEFLDSRSDTLTFVALKLPVNFFELQLITTAVSIGNKILIFRDNSFVVTIYDAENRTWTNEMLDCDCEPEFLNCICMPMI